MVPLPSILQEWTEWHLGLGNGWIVPRVPNERFAGKSGMGPRGDVILEADWCVSEFLKELDRLGLDDNTLVILTSDNGPVLDDGYKDDASI